MKVFDLLCRGAALAPDSIAVTHGDQQISYRELLLRVEKVAEHIKKTGIPESSPAAIYFENSIEYITVFFALHRAGLVVVPLDNSLKPDKIKFILEDCQAKILFIQGKYTRFLKDIVDSGTSLETIVYDKPTKFKAENLQAAFMSEILEADCEIKFEDIIEGIDNIAPLRKLDHTCLPPCPHELAAIFYTSGSTGSPKGVMLSHLNLVSNTVATVEYLKLTDRDAIMVILPFYYIYGNSLLLTHVMTGGRIVIDNRFAFPQVILENMMKEKVTGFSGVPSNFMILLNNANFNSAHLPELRYLTQAGGAMAPAVIQEVMKAFPDKEIYIMYGQTEASPRVSWLPPEKLPEKIGSIGIPVPGVTINLTDDNGNRIGVGEVGEITVSGDNVMLGYWHNPENEEVLKDGELYTGDLAYRDEDGYFFVVSRKKEIIKVGGNRVSAKEIEERLLEHEHILEAAIVGVSDDVLGEAIKAFIVLKGENTVSTKQLQDFVGASLARHKIPKYVEFLPELPKYPSGKVNKPALKAS